MKDKPKTDSKMIKDNYHRKKIMTSKSVEITEKYTLCDKIILFLALGMSALTVGTAIKKLYF